jgi:hypothetical protein
MDENGLPTVSVNTHEVVTNELVACVLSYFLKHNLDPENGGITFLRNIGERLPDYMVREPRRQNSP